jgi:hypothetical protein
MQTLPDLPEVAPVNWVWNWNWNCSDGSVGTSSLTPSTTPGWTWNWNWDCGAGSAAPPDLNACSGCNISISVRVLSPGDDGPVTQTNAASASTVIDELSSALQNVAESSPDPPPVPPLPVVPPSSAGTPPQPLPFGPPITVPVMTVPAIPLPEVAAQAGSAASVGLGGFQLGAVPVDPGPSTAPGDAGAEAQAATPAASPPGDAANDGTNRPESAAAPATTVPDAAPSSSVTRSVTPAAEDAPAGSATGDAGQADGATHARGHAVKAPSDPATAPNGVPATGPAPLAQTAPVAGDSAGSGVLGDSRIAAVGQQASRSSSRHGGSAANEAPAPVPIPQLPDQGSSPAAGAAGHGGTSSGSAFMALLAAFIFTSPGLAQWLRVGTERRPRLLRAGRRERPG